jgi:hypothetical protein
MTMTIKFKTIWTVLAIITVSGLSARADVTMTTRMTMDSPMMDQARSRMGPNQVAAINNMMRSMTYMSGKRYRVDSAIMSVIVDAGTKQMTMLNDTQHTYFVIPINPGALKGMMGGAGAAMAAGHSVKVVDTGKTTRYLGHTCRHYILTMTINMPQTGTMTMHSDILAAQDLPGLDAGVYQALAMQAGVNGNQMTGVPLLTVTKMSGRGPAGNMTMTQQVMSLSTAPISASRFEVPSGYRKTTQPALFGGMGVPGAPH